ncbi:ImmA/IrrE family metallo-endopeptidase [Enterococcus sp. AZ103]|uniref:ImmA/IrrE family metallo-endopeptidase n=1 Tax=Enterococcus sp. AZ103 TaxID=2774628 RepID=UPI003F289C70
MNDVKALLEKYGIKLIYLDMESSGFYLPEEKTIFVCDTMSDLEKIKVILHEVGHGALHEDLKELYKK